MDSRHLSKKQCEWLQSQLSEMAHRLCLIYQRMSQRKFPDDDEMYRLVKNAYDACLTADHHALSLCCQGQMGTTNYFRDQDGIGRTTPIGESPQPHE